MNIADRTRLDRIHEMACVCCQLNCGPLMYPVEAHHIIFNGYRRLSGGHQSTIPLCRWHHPGVCFDRSTATEMAEAYGPSLALSKRVFVLRYGSERQLLLLVNDRMRETA